MIPNTSHVVEIGKTSNEAPPKTVYEAWNDISEAQLFEWLQLPRNYEKWKCVGIRNSNGSMKTSALAKRAVTSIISAYLESLNTKKILEQVMNKMRYMEKKFKEVMDFLQSTGEGLTSNDEKLGITKIREKVVSICPFYFQVKSFMSESVAINPPYIGETSADENIPDILFCTSTKAKAFSCR